jgi:ProP effector
MPVRGSQDVVIRPKLTASVLARAAAEKTARHGKLRIVIPTKAAPPAPEPKPEPLITLTPASPAPVPASAAAEIEAKRPQRDTPPTAAAEARRKRAKAILAVLRERWPAAFCEPPRPLAVGISKHLRALLGAEVTGQDLSSAIYCWTARRSYFAALARGEMRVHLDGSPAGEPTPDDRETAMQRLQKLEARKDEEFRLALEAYRARAAGGRSRKAGQTSTG